ncbi:MAG: RNA polymerase sigma factor, partial [Planctomycetes bacterium]|nr:RNA polymerase sigma factor [Planctomycetota bacterium]
MPEATKAPLLDPDSVGVLWRELHGRVRQTVGSADRADDVVQETFLNALRRPPPDPRGLVPWLHVVARHLALRSRQRERNRSERERRAAATHPRWTSAPDGSKADGSEVEARQALRWLAVVGEPYREALRLRYLDGYEIEEIARRLGRSQGTVRSQIKRGLDRIRQHIGGQGPRTQRVSALVFLGAWRERWGAASGPMRWA